MTKPIEWTTTEPRLPAEMNHVLQVRHWRGAWSSTGDATPSDLVAALSAMGEGERAEVLGSALQDERVARREWVDETRVIIRALPTESIQDAARRVVRERDEEREALRRAHELCAEVTQKRIQAERECTAATARAEKAERERAEFRDRAEKAERDRDEARLDLDRVRASLDVVRHDLAGTRQELREERDKLAVRGVTADAFRAATDRAEAALRAERTACDRAEKAAAEIAEARASADRAWRAVSEARKEQLLAEGAQEKAERERDEASGQRDRFRDSLAYIRTAVGAAPGGDETLAEVRRVVAERDSLRTRLIAAESAAAAREPETRGCSYADAVTLFRRDPSASWTCDELQKNHGPDARCRFSQEEARMMFAHPAGFYSGPYTPTRAEELATDWRRVEAKTEAARPPREYPLAEGSRWDGGEIVDLDGTRTSAVGRTGGAHIWCVGPWGEKRFPRIANVLALAHRRGMV